jgi:hypothetical protein
MKKEALTKMTRSRHLFKCIPLLLLTLWLAFFSLSASAATRPASTPDFAAIDTYVLSQMNTLHIPAPQISGNRTRKMALATSAMAARSASLLRKRLQA